MHFTLPCFVTPYARRAGCGCRSCPVENSQVEVPARGRVRCLSKQHLKPSFAFYSDRSRGGFLTVENGVFELRLCSQ